MKQLKDVVQDVIAKEAVKVDAEGAHSMIFFPLR